MTARKMSHHLSVPIFWNGIVLGGRPCRQKRTRRTVRPRCFMLGFAKIGFLILFSILYIGFNEQIPLLSILPGDVVLNHRSLQFFKLLCAR